MNITAATNQLVQAITATSEFSELKKARLIVYQSPVSKDALDQFQKKQEMLYSSNLTEAQARQLMNDIDRDYNKLSSIAEFKRYFTAVDNFNTVIGNIHKTINTNIENSLH